MSTIDETTAAVPAQTTSAEAPKTKAPAVKKPAKAKAKVATKTAAKVAKKTAAKAVKKVPAKKAAAKKTGTAKAKLTSQRGKGPANLRNELHKMLLKKLPEKYRLDKESLDFAKIAKDQGMTIEGVYKWFRVDRVTPTGVMTFEKMGGGKLKLADFHPFVFKK